MQKYSKLSLIYFIKIVSIIVLYIATVIFLHDPLQIWHSPFFRQQITYSNNIRESAKAMIRNEDFDSVIIGNSHFENTSCKIAENLFGGKFINLSISGSTLYEKNLILTYLLKRKNIKQVIDLLDENYLNLSIEPHQYKTKQYSFLYNNNPFDDYKIYLNNKYFFATLFFSNHPKYIGFTRNIDKPYAWENNWFHNQRFGGFEKWLKHKNNEQIKDYFKKILDTPLEINKQNISEEYKKQLHKYLDEYLIENIKKYPNIEFDIVISPISNIELARRIRDKENQYAKYCEALKYLTSKKDSYSNLKLYAFNNDLNLSKIENYKDGTHYKTWVNHYILKSIKINKYELNSKNIDKYLKDVYNIAKQFNYEYYYNQIKNIDEE